MTTQGLGAPLLGTAPGSRVDEMDGDFYRGSHRDDSVAFRRERVDRMVRYGSGGG